MEMNGGGKYLGEIHMDQESVNFYSCIGECPS